MNRLNILQMSFSASILILVIIVIRALAINKLPKKTFLVLWAVALLRLLLPFSLSSPFSVYSIISNNKIAAYTMMETPAANVSPITLPIQISTGGNTITQPSVIQNLPLIWAIIWMAGIIVFALYFVISYIKCYKEFQTSIVVKNNFVSAWLAEHKIVRTISIRQSNRISSPLTYGVFRPVILVPQKTDWTDESQLKYILEHEFVHIKRFDTATKLFLTAALCIHWFNPLVWAMYILSNRDIELSCDEAVVRSFGETIKSIYASILVSMEERKSAFTPYYNSFSKNAIEERIIAIMKIKKTSIIAVFIAITMVAGITTVFATSAVAKSNDLSDAIPSTAYTAEEYAILRSFQFDGYQNMSIAEYKEKILTAINQNEGYHNLLFKRMWEDKDFLKMRYTNKMASFYCNTLMPTLFQETSFGDGLKSKYSAQYDGGAFEYLITRTILDDTQLTVGEHDKMIQGIMNDLQSFFQSKNTTELDFRNKNVMDTVIHKEIEQLKNKWETKAVQFDIEYSYIPLRIVFQSKNGGIQQ